MKSLLWSLAIFLLASCANQLRRDPDLARLSDARPNVTMVDHVRYRSGEILLTPGKHLVQKNCATPPSLDNSISAASSTPAIEYVFEAGSTYMMECKGNAIDIGRIEY